MENYEGMTFEQAKARLSSAVYEAALLYERLEGVRKVRGNGHHMAQDIAAKAVKLLEERWTGDKA